jgi:hypothetical protein
MLTGKRAIVVFFKLSICAWVERKREERGREGEKGRSFFCVFDEIRYVPKSELIRTL